MARKSLAVALIIVLVVSMSLAFVLPNTLHGPAKTNNDASKYASYTQMQLFSSTNYVGQFGGYNYVFIYYPTTIIGGSTVQGYLTVCRQGVSTPTQFPLTLNTSNDYCGITFAITQVDPRYIILMVNTI